MLNFTELSKDGNDFELLIREILYQKGLEVYWTGKGPDGGKDLICVEHLKGTFNEIERRWLVQCKHYSRSKKAVGDSDIFNIVDKCIENKASGFLLACSTIPSSPLKNRLRAINDNEKINIKTEVWDGIRIEQELLKPFNWNLAVAFFPQSMKKSGWQVSPLDNDTWAINRKGYLFYIKTRIGQNYIDYLDFFDKLLELIDNRNRELPANVFFRLRGIYVDDKNTNCRVYQDFLVPETISGEENQQLIDIISKWDLLSGAINGLTFDYDIAQIQYDRFSDRFDQDSHKYYRAALPYIRTGSERDTNNFLSYRFPYECFSEEVVQGHFQVLCNTLKKFDFIHVVDSQNAQIEKINFLVTDDDFDMDALYYKALCCARIRVIIQNEKELKALSDVVADFPNDYFQQLRIERDYPVIPNKGIRKKESICTIELSVGMDTTHRLEDIRRALNDYFDDIVKVLENKLKTMPDERSE